LTPRSITPEPPTLITLLNILKITNTPRNTVKKPWDTLATGPLDQVKTYKMEFDMFNMNRNMAKEYEEHMEYEENKEFDEEFNTDRSIAKGHITFL
jgi:hypothetical protein